MGDFERHFLDFLENFLCSKSTFKREQLRFNYTRKVGSTLRFVKHRNWSQNAFEEVKRLGKQANILENVQLRDSNFAKFCPFHPLLFRSEKSSRCTVTSKITPRLVANSTVFHAKMKLLCS